MQMNSFFDRWRKHKETKHDDERHDESTRNADRDPLACRHVLNRLGPRPVLGSTVRCSCKQEGFGGSLRSGLTANDDIEVFCQWSGDDMKRRTL